MRSRTSNGRARLVLSTATLETVAIILSLWLVQTAIGRPAGVDPTAFGFGIANILRGAALVLILQISLTAMGLYQLDQRLYFREIVFRLVVGTLSAGAVLIALRFLVPSLMFDYAYLAESLICAFILLLALRFVIHRTVDENVFRRRTLIYGNGKRAASIDDLKRKADRRGFRIVGRVVPRGGDHDQNGDILVHDRPLSEIAEECSADEIVIALDDRRGKLPVRELLDARLSGTDVLDLIDFIEREAGKIRVDLVNPGWLIFSPGFEISTFRRFCQRSIDLLASLTLLIVSWPVMILVIAMIKIEDGIRAPVIYRQIRVGLGGKNFAVLKFRSMSVDAEADGQARWATESDDRVTRVGGVLRKFRLDELPQIFNVLAGQMALVGPRPERPEFSDKLKEKIPYYAERHSVKPGVTGWAQLKYAYGASDQDAVEKLHYDLYYVKNQGVLLDILIILQTVEVVLWRKGAR